VPFNKACKLRSARRRIKGVLMDWNDGLQPPPSASDAFNIQLAKCLDVKPDAAPYSLRGWARSSGGVAAPLSLLFCSAERLPTEIRRRQGQCRGGAWRLTAIRRSRVGSVDHQTLSALLFPEAPAVFRSADQQLPHSLICMGTLPSRPEFY
jgi:hypothetical protein